MSRTTNTVMNLDKKNGSGQVLTGFHTASRPVPEHECVKSFSAALCSMRKALMEKTDIGKPTPRADYGEGSARFCFEEKEP